MEKPRLHLTRKKIAQFIFLVMVTALTVSLVEATITYVEFQSAVKNFELQSTDLQVSIDTSDINLAINFTFTNPTAYRGFELKSLLTTFYYEGESHILIISPGGPRVGTPYQAIETNWWELTTDRELVINQYLNPFSNIKKQMTATVKGQNAELFINFYEMQGRFQQNIRWMITSRVNIYTQAFISTLTFDFQHALNSTLPNLHH